MIYSRQVMEHFQNPKNMGEIANADGIGKVGNPKCGDVMYIFIRVGTRIKGQGARGKSQKTRSLELGSSDSTEEFIEDIKFKTLGCAAAIASSSVTTELARGKSLDEALKMTKDDINEALGKLPAPKYHCSILAEEGIKKAILDYKSRQN